MLLENAFVIVLLLLSTAFHEMAHAFSANWLGDPTPGRHGRLTLNPVPHLQPVMTAVILPVIMYLTNQSLMILAQTPIDPSRFRKPLRDHALVAIAGPLTNVLMAAIFVGILWIPGLANPYIYSSDGTVLTVSRSLSYKVLREATMWNLVLAMFNMIPIPPLDGYWIARTFLPLRVRIETDKFARNPMSFIVVMLAGSFIVGRYIPDIQLFVQRIIPG